MEKIYKYPEALKDFLTYVQIDTQSDETSLTSPSTKKQYDLLHLLEKQLKELGYAPEINEYGLLYCRVPGKEGLETVGLCSHVDTASELTGKNVKPRIIEDYDGGTIKLNEHYSMSPEEFPSLRNRRGQTLVVTDGNTLLGGDDKAGVAAIMGVARYYAEHKDLPHRPFSILFTVDEEIGRGADHFDAKAFGADFAYTVDGDDYHDIAYDNFNAAHVDIKIKGVTIHPGEAKGKLVNAASLASRFDTMLGYDLRPEKTEGREGFNHLVSLKATGEEASMHYIVRNHEATLLKQQLAKFEEIAEELRKEFPTAEISLTTGVDYRNMKEKVDEDPRSVELAKKVFKELGIEAHCPPIRGGTDGANFSFKGCITPNLGTGSYNHHGRFEFLSIDEFEKIIDILVGLLKA